jgi:hypothetical protein
MTDDHITDGIELALLAAFVLFVLLPLAAARKLLGLMSDKD